MTKAIAVGLGGTNLYRMLKQKVFKLKAPITNIQVPGMALWSNAGLPLHFIFSAIGLRRAYEKSNCFC